MKIEKILLEEKDIENILTMIEKRFDYPYLRIDEETFSYDIAQIGRIPQLKNSHNLNLEVYLYFKGYYDDGCLVLSGFDFSILDQKEGQEMPSNHIGELVEDKVRELLKIEYNI